MKHPALVPVGRPNPATASRTALLVHGTMDRSTSFRAVGRHLPEWTVLAYDRRGWGASRDLGGAGTVVRDHVDDLCELLLQTPGAVVAGHSYGGMVALDAAARRPELFGGLVLYEPPLRWLPWWPADAKWELLVRAAPDPDAAAEALLRAVLGDQGWTRLGSRLQRNLLLDGPALLTEMNDKTQDLVTFDPVEMRVPTVVAAGETSAPHHREVSRRLAALLPNGQFWDVPEAGHTAHVTHPQAFAGLIERAAMPIGQGTR